LDMVQIPVLSRQLMDDRPVTGRRRKHRCPPVPCWKRMPILPKRHDTAVAEDVLLVGSLPGQPRGRQNRRMRSWSPVHMVSAPMLRAFTRALCPYWHTGYVDRSRGFGGFRKGASGLRSAVRPAQKKKIVPVVMLLR